MDIRKLREFKLSSFAVDNGTSVFLLTIMIMIFGIQSYDSMPKEQYPEASFPNIFINTPYFGNSAVEIENLINRPLEKELKTISGIKNVSSTAIQDFSSIVAEFEADMEMEEALRKVKDAVDKAKPELPTDLDQEPSVVEVNLADVPIMTVNLSGDYPPDQLKKYGEFLQDEIENVKQVNKVDIKGALEREVRIDMDMLKMKSLMVSFQDIENAIIAENQSISGGEIINNDFRRSIRVLGQFLDVSEIQNIIVKSEKNRPIYLKDIGTVEFGFKDRTSYARSDKLPVVSLDVIKRKGENLLYASDNIKEIIETSGSDLPEDLKISIFNDQSVNTRTEVDNLENSIISGVILVTLVLLFFLGLRNASFVGLAIPLSMLMGIMFLNLTGVTMNIVVLFALILALGLLVDNAIVVVENIYRYMQEGYSGLKAAKYGAGEVAVPIIASTATTLAAFIPLAFWPGIVGEFMKYMPITLMIVLSSSLFVALVINPVFTSRFMKVDLSSTHSVYKRKRRNILIGILLMIGIAILAHFISIFWIRNLLGFVVLISLLNFFFLRPASLSFQKSFMPVLERIYNKFINLALRRYNPYFIFAGTFALLFIAIGLLSWKSPKIEYFTSTDPMYVNVFVELPLGSDIEATNEFMKVVEDKVIETVAPYSEIVEAVLSQIGENTSDPMMPPEPGVTPHKARLTVSFVPVQDRNGISSKKIMNEIRENLTGYAGVQIVVDKNADGPPTGMPINLEIRGDDIDELLNLSDQIIQYLNNQSIPGIENLKADVKLGKPELLINVDREAARRYGISTGQIAGTLRTSVFGKEISKFKIGEDEHPIQLRLDEKYRNDINALLTQPVTFRDQARQGKIVQLPISAVAKFNYSSTYNSIKRKNQKRMITIFSNVLDGYNANEIVTELKTAMQSFTMPLGYTSEFTGEQQQQAEDMVFLSNAFMVAIFTIFIIIVAQFNSIISPFIIILSVLFSTIGVLLGYIVSGMTISIVFTGVGIISLAGIVVNNAIVLIDFINLSIKRQRIDLGYENMDQLAFSDIKKAIIIGGATRLRPVLLTAITTVLGLIPLAIGFNFNFFTLITDLDPQFFLGGNNTAFWGPMAWTVIYGLIFATFLTLIVVPVMYWIAVKIRYWVMNLFRRREGVVRA